MRTFAVGDIHGHARPLADLITLLLGRAARGDALVFVGDYVDRGPDSFAAVELVMALKRGGWPGPVTCLRGNHEAMMLDHLAGTGRYDAGLWLWNGGGATLASYGSEVPFSHIGFIRGLDVWHEDEHAYYVHAGMRPGLPADGQLEEDLLWIRGDFLEAEYSWGKPVVFGHTPQAAGMVMVGDPATQWRPLNEPAKIGIDTGACYGGPLTAVILPEREFVSVPTG